MHTPGSEHSDRPQKRLRLGTRSCTECRRRKVRCIFPPDSKVCKGCLLHDIPCISQREGEKSLLDQGQNLQQRLQDLEGMVRRICQAVDLDFSTSSLAEFECRATEALKRLQPPLTPETGRDDSSVTTRRSVSLSEAGRLAAPTDSIALSDDAPLLGLFKDALLIQNVKTLVSSEGPGLSDTQRVQTCLTSIKAFIPNLDDMSLILRATEKYWKLWQDAQGLKFTLDHRQLESVESAKNFVLRSLGSESPAIICKCLLFLSFCIQQLPVTFRYEPTNLPAPLNAILDAFITGIEALLFINDMSAQTIDDLECFCMLQRIYINAGKPRKSWLSCRRGLSLALLLGLENSDPKVDGRGNASWNTLWQFDRYISTSLGLPSATWDTHPGIINPYVERSIRGQFMYELAIIIGQINERNQHRKDMSYSKTFEIDLALRKLRNSVLPEWWDPAPDPFAPLDVVYTLAALKMHYYTAIKFAHLPYMLVPSPDDIYGTSRQATVEACRGMVACYQALRNHNGGDAVICDLMDFLMFTGAITIIINILSNADHVDVIQETKDWELVHSATRSLRRISDLIDCSVACQAAQTLEYLSMAYHGTYTGQEVYEAVIPYFGKICINTSKVNRTAAAQSHGIQSLSISQVPSSVEFNVNSFMPMGLDPSTDYFSDAELGLDWTNIYDANVNYDWNKIFDDLVVGQESGLLAMA